MFDFRSFLFGCFIVAVPGAYLLGKTHAYRWETLATICTANEEKRNVEIEKLLQAASAQGVPVDPPTHVRVGLRSKQPLKPITR